MSNEVNTILVEEAQELMEYWTGTAYEKALRFAAEAGDLDNLKYQVDRARRDMEVSGD